MVAHPPSPAQAELASGRRHTIVLSDVHLSQAHPLDPADPLWMRYRIAALHPDRDLGRLLDELGARIPREEPAELVFNGDLFDFDAPWVKGGESSFDEVPLTEQGSAEHLLRILDDHTAWFRATLGFLRSGLDGPTSRGSRRVLFVSGNHDMALTFPGVRAAMLAWLAALWSATFHEPAPADLHERVRFRGWFHVTDDGIYLEHGNQYDHLNCVRFPLLPYTRTRTELHPVAGNLAFRRTGARMGYFNPYYEETFYLGLKGYVGHYLEHYARSSTRHIGRTWVKGALDTTLQILRERHHEPWHEEHRALARAETGACDEAIDATLALATPSGEVTMVPILRELWVDRAGLTVATVLLTGTAAITAGRAAALGTIGAIGAAWAYYERTVPKPDLRSYDRAPPRVLGLFDIHGARAICMGHTHRPFGAYLEHEGGARFSGNSGSWCPAFEDAACERPVLEARPLLWLTTEGEALWGGLFWLRADALEPDPREHRGAPTAG